MQLGASVIAGLAAGAALVVLFSFYMGSSSLPLLAGSNKDLVITLERTVCFGRCPDYDLTIYGNGTVVYEGHNFVAVTGKQTSLIPQGKVQALVDYFHESGFFSMDDVYGSVGGDAPAATTSFKTDGAFKKVVNYGSPDAPQRLYDLEARIDMIANSEKWVVIR